MDNTDFEWLMIDASHVKVHPDAADARGRDQAMDCTKGGPQGKALRAGQSEALLKKDAKHLF